MDNNTVNMPKEEDYIAITRHVNGENDIDQFIPVGTKLTEEARRLGPEFFREYRIRDSIYTADTADSALYVENKIQYDEDTGLMFTMDKHIENPCILHVLDSYVTMALDLAKSGSTVRYDTTYIYRPDNGYWLPLRSPEGIKYLVSELRITNVTVNYKTAAEPYIRLIEDNAKPVSVPMDTICIGKTRYKFYVRGNRMVLEPHVVIRKKHETMTRPIESYTFATRPISTKAAVISSNISITSIIESHLNSLVGSDICDVLMWNIGNGLIDSSTAFKSVMLHSKGGTGKSTVLNKLSWIVGDTCATMSDNYIGERRTIPSSELGLYTSKRFLFYGDVSITEGKINEQAFKVLTSGDLVNYNDTSIKLMLTLFLATNDSIASGSHYRESWFTRRMVIVPFTKRSVSSKVLRNNYSESARLSFLLKCVAFRKTNRAMPTSPVIAAYTLWRKASIGITRGISDKNESNANAIEDLMLCALRTCELSFGVDVFPGLTSEFVDTSNDSHFSRLINESRYPVPPANYHMYKIEYTIVNSRYMVILRRLVDDDRLPDNVTSRDDGIFVYDKEYARQVSNTTINRRYSCTNDNDIYDTGNSYYNTDDDNDTRSQCDDDYDSDDDDVRRFTPVTARTSYRVTRYNVSDIGSFYTLPIMRNFAAICEYIIEYLCGGNSGHYNNKIDMGLLLAVSGRIATCDLTNILIHIRKPTWTGLDREDRRLLYCMCKSIIRDKIVTVNGILPMKSGYKEVGVHTFMNSRVCTHIAAARSGYDVDEMIELLSTISNTTVCFARIHGSIIPYLAMNGIFMDKQFNKSFRALHDIGKESRVQMLLYADVNT